MPIRYVGRESLQKGKTLYEICRRLANAGVGRVVYRHRHAENWPTQKSYYRLTKVIPDKTCTEFRKGDAWGDRVFRGAQFGEQRIGSGHKSDWRLVPKNMEEEFCKITEVWPEPPKPPSHIPAPPWMNVLMKRQNGKSADEPLTIPLERLVKQTQRVEKES